MIEIITKDSWKTSQWAGGETHEIFLYPADGSYKDRNFTARISMATTKDASKSTFTALPGVHRFISLVDGDMHLTFEGRYDKHLQKNEVIRFEGDWEAYTLGKYLDFNFMLKGASGHLNFQVAAGETLVQAPNEVERLFVFVLTGEVLLNDKSVTPNSLILTDKNQLAFIAKDASFYFGYITR